MKLLLKFISEILTIAVGVVIFACFCLAAILNFTSFCTKKIAEEVAHFADFLYEKFLEDRR